MAAQIKGIVHENLREAISNSKVLVVGAGGIGCELLKNIVLTGFKEVEIIDFDTIAVSNLNRQFLFLKEHVGKSKAVVAKESALKFSSNVNITAHHDSIMNDSYGVSFFKQFSLCLSALDNRTARSHVNRMCLAANIPLVESGTAGYFGQVTVIKKGITECYECSPAPYERGFPGCTIRNTPNEAIHCIVWAKHLFNQLFGEEDPDEDVSPDTEDPEARGDDVKDDIETQKKKEVSERGNVERRSTRKWASECGYNTQKLFNKFFHDDIFYLLSMDKLWNKRRAPIPLEWDSLSKTENNASRNGELLDQEVWSVSKCSEVLDSSIQHLKASLSKLPKGDHLVWNKDNSAALDFVTACANIRAHIFNIDLKSRFEVKSMAGNIIPAIATTNAIIAGCIVMEAIKIFNNEIENCRTVYLRKELNPRNKTLVTETLVAPNSKCYVCSEKPEVSVKLNLETTSVKTLEEKILKGSLNMVAPDAIIETKGTILISSEKGETDSNNEKSLKEFGLVDGSILKCDDFLQNYQLTVYLYHADKLEDGVDFVIAGDESQFKPKAAEEKKEEEHVQQDFGNSQNAIEVADDDHEDAVIEVLTENGGRSNKRIGDESRADNGNSKRAKISGDDDIVIYKEVEAPFLKPVEKRLSEGPIEAICIDDGPKEAICID